MSKLIRVLVVDDSALMRRVITAMLEQDQQIKVVGAACDGREAITLVQDLQPDVVTMDVRMPVMDGLSTTEHLMAYHPTPILVLTASLASYEVDITFKMLEAGALEVIEKPRVGDSQALNHAARDLIRRIKVLSRVQVVTHLRGRRKSLNPDTPVAPQLAPRPATDKDKDKPKSPTINAGAFPAYVMPMISPTAFPLIIIGASTGGPRMVHHILSELPPNFPAAVLVVQHIAEGFSSGMVEWFSSSCKMPVVLATEGYELKACEVLVAPDRRDLLITQEGRVHLSKTPLLIQRPAIDITMQAAAEIYGARVIGVLLTGMGRDGPQGMLTIRRNRGYTIAQDEATSAIFGMPRAAIQLGAVNEILPGPQIATRLMALISEMGNSRSVNQYRSNP